MWCGPSPSEGPEGGQGWVEALEEDQRGGISGNARNGWRWASSSTA